MYQNLTCGCTQGRYVNILISQRLFLQFSLLPLSMLSGVMKGLALLKLALVAKVNAFHNRSNCTKEFRTILEKAAEIKKNHCNIRGFYDCYEVYFPSTYTSKLGYLQPLDTSYSAYSIP